MAAGLCLVEWIRRSPSGDFGGMAVHGEYKVPGGKLVVVDLDVEGGALRNVRVAA